VRLIGSQFFVPLMATLLVMTTPMGTGQGVHENELLHPVWAHVHLVNGQIVSDAQLAAGRAAATAERLRSRPSGGQALGAGSGAGALESGVGLGPTLPILGLALPGALERRLRVFESDSPTEFRDPPQDPPPNLFA
jgi:hypothetical protein